MTIDEKLKAFFEGKKVVILGFGRGTFYIEAARKL